MGNFFNTSAPLGPSKAKKFGVKALKLAKFSARGLGDTAAIDITNPPGPNGVLAVATVTNAVDGNTYRMCTRWATSAGSIIRHEIIDGGLGRKLFLEKGVVASCTVVPTTTSTSSSITTTTSTSTSSTTTTSTSTTSTTSTTLFPPPIGTVLSFVTGAPTGSCGTVRRGGASGTILKSLGCGGLNVGGGGSTVAEGPTPAGAETQMNTACVGSTCTVSGRTAAQTGTIKNCSGMGCIFGPYLPIANLGTSTCVQNTFASPATGTLNSVTGTFTGGFPLSSTVYLTANSTFPCPKCVGGTIGVTNGTCQTAAQWTSGSGPSPDAGMPCARANAAGDTYDCAPPLASVLPAFPVNLTPITTGVASDSDPGGLFCPLQANAGAFGCNGTATPLCPGGAVGVPDYINEVGAAAGVLNAGPHAATLASTFCIPSVGGALGFLINGAANLPGPGATSLPGTLTLLP